MLQRLLSLLGIYKVYEKWLWRQVKSGTKPEHIAIILDGNRRWASSRAYNPWIGHHYGAEKVEELLRWCLELGVRSITLYAFSTENFRRSSKEVNEIMLIAKQKLAEVLKERSIHKNRLRVRAIGRLGLLPKEVQELFTKVEESTKQYNERFLNVAIAYGGRAEIIDATKEIAKRVKTGQLAPEDINEKLFEKHLYTAYLPKQDPDLIIRTSGEERLSGFLSWQSAYSELCFLDINWPEFRRIDLLRAVRTYQRRKRRFGG